MARTHILGFPRIGAGRELKSALEAYWQGQLSRDALVATGKELRQRHWRLQSGLDWIAVGDFSFYDHVLDMSFTLGNLPKRVRDHQGHEIDNVFRVARGRSGGHDAEHGCCHAVAAGEMTKWFDTNYHYIVPEFDATTQFSLNASRLVEQYTEAAAHGMAPKPVIVGPLTYLALGKTKDNSDKLKLLPSLLPVYAALLQRLAEAGARWVQIDEPILVTDLDPAWQAAFHHAYQALSETPIKLLLATYFGRLEQNLTLATDLPVAGLHLDATNAASEIPDVLKRLRADQVLSLGVVDGRNVWKSDLRALLDMLEPISADLGDRLWIGSSCSLLHIPTDLELEADIDVELRSWLAFATQRIEEVRILGKALNEGRNAVRAELEQNRTSLQSRRLSTRVRNPALRTQLAMISPTLGQRRSPFQQRAPLQKKRFDLPLFPTTTIGSFPQTEEIRRSRRQYKAGQLDETQYREAMKKEIERCIREQEDLGLDVLVHGEAERNDMVEYFGEQLDGFAFSRHGWVQSYGSRCVKPPILYGDVQRSKPITTEWTLYAQSLTSKPVKGMLTGPVTILNWSFVRDDQPRSASCLQIAMAIRAEVQDLERAGVSIIQIDEAALREGLPLRRSEWDHYLEWAIGAYRIAANGVEDETQIHTHMCYSEFNDIIAAIAEMDADVITIETSRSGSELLQAFDTFAYPNDIGPGVYDIHSPNVPSREAIIDLIQKAGEKIPVRRLWVNPDCGLKTRSWTEVTPALKNMVDAARELREIYYRS